MLSPCQLKPSFYEYLTKHCHYELSISIDGRLMAIEVEEQAMVLWPQLSHCSDFNSAANL